LICQTCHFPGNLTWISIFSCLRTLNGTRSSGWSKSEVWSGNVISLMLYDGNNVRISLSAKLGSYCKAAWSKNAQGASLVRWSNRIHKHFTWISLASYMTYHSSRLWNADDVTTLPSKPDLRSSFSVPPIVAKR
jgi:hypothetical protein